MTLLSLPGRTRFPERGDHWNIQASANSNSKFYLNSQQNFYSGLLVACSPTLPWEGVPLSCKIYTYRVSFNMSHTFSHCSQLFSCPKNFELSPRYYLWFTNSFVYYGLTLNSGRLVRSLLFIFSSFFSNAFLKSISFSLLPGSLHINFVIGGALEVLKHLVEEMWNLSQSSEEKKKHHNNNINDNDNKNNPIPFQPLLCILR